MRYSVSNYKDLPLNTLYVRQIDSINLEDTYFETIFYNRSITRIRCFHLVLLLVRDICLLGNLGTRSLLLVQLEG